MYPVTGLLSERLKRGRFRIHTGEELGAQPVRFVASKTVFVPAVLGLMSTHIVVLEKDGVKPHDIDNLFDKGFKFGKQINWIPLLRGMQFGYVIMPLVVGRNPDHEALLYAIAAPSWRFALIEFPIVVDLTGNRCVFFDGYVKRGAALWPSIQRIVTKYIEPVVDESFGQS